MPKRVLLRPPVEDGTLGLPTRTASLANFADCLRLIQIGESLIPNPLVVASYPRRKGRQVWSSKSGWQTVSGLAGAVLASCRRCSWVARSISAFNTPHGALDFECDSKDGRHRVEQFAR
eukprot:2876396-Amphidinium_carterae.1